jgi:hypothetical protein
VYEIEQRLAGRPDPAIAMTGTYRGARHRHTAQGR